MDIYRCDERILMKFRVAEAARAQEKVNLDVRTIDKLSIRNVSSLL